MATRKRRNKIRNKAVAGELTPAKVIIRVFTYNAAEISEHTFPDFTSLKKHLEATPDKKHWIDIEGKNDKAFFGEFIQYFKVHELVMEDLLSVDQRSKVDELDHCLLIISRMLYFDKTEQLINEQVGFLVFDSILITIQDEWEDCFEAARDKLKRNRLNVRNENSFSLAQIVFGGIIDNYFPMMDTIADKLDILEDELIKDPTRETSNKIQELKHLLIFLRKFIRPERDVVNHLLTLQHEWISEKNKLQLRDIYDHCIQVNDMVDSYREIAYSLMDVYLSSISNKTNEVMKVLTVITVIFIPLTFIAGVYGMNFPNMPELQSPNGYYVVMGFMILVGLIEILYFRKRKWL